MKKSANRTAIWCKQLGILAIIVGLLLSVGCTQQPNSPAPTEPTAQTSSTEPTQKAESPTVYAVDDVRKAMDGTSQTFAAAYFGYAYVDDLPQLLAHMKNRAPTLCETMPFLLEISEENVIGDYYGNVYAIIPKDPAATVTVTKAVIDDDGEAEYTDLLFSSENGAPLLLQCNVSDIDADTEVRIVNADGTETVWYPHLNDNHFVQPLLNDNGDDAFWDCSAYAEHLAADYAALQTENWILPEKSDLMGHAWGCETTTSDGRYETHLLSFGENTVYVRWNDGIDEADHEYPEADWELTHENGFAVLTIDFGNFAGILRYNLLYDAEYDQLYTMIDASTGHVEPGMEPLFRYLDARSMDAPNPADMVGSWERFRWEADGSPVEDEDGERTVTIVGKTEEDLAISMTAHDSPDHSYSDKALRVKQGVIYSDCGNNLWFADVDHVGPWDTTYAVTLLEDDTLMIQSYWEPDGARMVSYEWFRRV